MAVKWLEGGSDATFGFEFFQLTQGTTASDSGTIHTGPRSLKFTSGAAGENARAFSPASTCQDAGTRISFWVNLTNLPTTNGIALLTSVDSGINFFVFKIRVTTGGNLSIVGNGVKTGSSTLSTGTWYRIAVSYVITSTTNFTIAVFLNGISEVTATNSDFSLANSGSGAAGFGWDATDGTGGNSKVVYFDDLYIDDGTGLDDPGAIQITAKLPASTNANNFDTTIGTGAVNERPLSETNGMQQAASTQVSQNYTLQTVSTGDVDLTGATIVGRLAWIWAKEAAVSGTPKITNNGTDTAITLAATSALYRNAVTSASYPSDAAGIGMVSSGTADDTFLYECGMLIAFTPASTAAQQPGVESWPIAWGPRYV